MGVKLACLATFMLNILANSQHDRRQYAAKSIRKTMLAQWRSSTLCLQKLCKARSKEQREIKVAN